MGRLARRRLESASSLCRPLWEVANGCSDLCGCGTDDIEALEERVEEGLGIDMDDDGDDDPRPQYTLISRRVVSFTLFLSG